jgi:hypothetical protein
VSYHFNPAIGSIRKAWELHPVWISWVRAEGRRALAIKILSEYGQTPLVGELVPIAGIIAIKRGINLDGVFESGNL